MAYLKKYYIWIASFILILLCLPGAQVLAASKLNLYLYSTKKSLTYSGTMVSYDYEGAKINMNKTSGIVLDGTSLGSFLDVFVNSEIGLSYSYNKSKGTLTLSLDSKKMVLTEGSKVAIVDGKKMTMSLAPTRITFKDVNKTKFMVPVRFVAENFGYTYTWNSKTRIGSITKPLQLYYNNKSVTYSGTRGSVVVDSNPIDVMDLPSLIINNTALVQAYKVFADSTVGASYHFDEETNTLTLCNDTTNIQLTMGSKAAKVNGKLKNMDTAPLVVTNLDTDFTSIMVPGGFVAYYLGYDYNWNTTTKTSILKKSPILNVPEQSEEESLPDKEVLPDGTLLTLSLQPTFLNEYNNLSSITNVTEGAEDKSYSSYITSITMEGMTQNSETYAIRGTLPFSKSILTKEDSTVSLHINNATSFAQTYMLGGFLAGSIVATTQDTASSTGTTITFHLTDPSLKYELSVSADGYTIYVRMFRNLIYEVSAGVSSGLEYLQITGIKELEVTITESDNLITLQMPGTVNGVGDNNIATTLDTIHNLAITSLGNMTILTFEKTGSDSYTIVKNGNQYRIVFGADTTEYTLLFNLPPGVSFQSITTQDQYYNNRILIKLPGDHVSYFMENGIKWSGNMVNKVGLLLKDGFTQIIIETASIQGYKLAELSSGVVGITLGDPQDIYEHVVVLDAGHGGTDPGAIRKLNGITYYEKDLNFTILYELAKQYFDAPDSKIKAYYTRYNDTLINLYDRAAFSDQVDADMFISLHMNANTKTAPKGTEIYYYASNTSTNAAGLNSKTLANIFLESITSKLGTQKRYISSKNLVVTRESNVPSVLIELGFMSNKEDLALLTDDIFQEEAAYAIYLTICEIFETY